MHIKRINIEYNDQSCLTQGYTEPPSFFDLACEVGTASDSNYRIGAVIHNKNRLVCSGWNQLNKTHPMQARFRNRDQRLFLHAEVHAIVRARQSVEGMSITVGRKHKLTNTWGSSRPCSGCMAAIKWAGIKNVNYFHQNQFITESGR